MIPNPLSHLGRAAAAAALVVAAAVPAGRLPFAPTAVTAGSPALAAGTEFFVPPPDQDAVRQIAQLTASGQRQDAALIRAEVGTPQAVWFTGGSPEQARRAAWQTAERAAAGHTVPVLVAYNVPGRDCSQYSSGGAGSDEAYRAWIDGLAAGLSRGHRVVVVIEPDGLANLPSDCPGAYPGQDVAALTAGRIADIRYAAHAVGAADPQALIYLDAGHSAWHSVGEIARRLDLAGVADVQGFAIDVSNHQPTPQLEQYGSWIAKCQYFAHNAAEGGWRLGHYDYCASQYYPATASDYSTWYLTDNWYADNVDQAAGAPTDPATQLDHFVIDTSRNGRGPWTTTASYPDKQDWCNPPYRGLGARPTADTGAVLADALLWIKTPGQSDGQCNRGMAGGTADPEWAAITGVADFVDPPAGEWFPQQALQLATLAIPALAPVRAAS